MVNKQGQNDISESVIISQKVIPYLRNLGYRYIESEVRVPIGSQIVAADVVVYLDEEKSKPYVVVETKRRLRHEIALLDPAVQNAFTSAVALGDQVRYLMITDGDRYHWFERSAEGQSLIQLSSAPEAPREIYQPPLFEPPLAPVTDPEQFLRLLQSVIDALRQEGVVFGLRMAIELNRILIAKLYDEQTAKNGETYRFSSEGYQAELVATRIEQLYQEAITDSGGTTIEEGIWSLSPRALLTVVKILEPYALTSVSPSVRGRFFWQAFSGLLRREGQYASPVPLAEFLVQLVQPIPGERIIDPACGTGLFLIEAFRHVRAQITAGRVPPANLSEIQRAIRHTIVGIERNAEVAELAATNLALNGLPPNQVIKANALDKRNLESSGVELGTYDVVLLDPPIGTSVIDEHILNQFGIARPGVRTSLEVLFVERGVELLHPGGRLALLVPDSFLSAPRYLRAREWVLHNTLPRAIISLPVETFIPVGHSGKATILLLENETPSLKAEEPVLIADVQAVGYDRFGRPTGENDLPELLEMVRHFRTTGQIDTHLQEDELRIWQITVGELSAERLDVTWLDPEGQKLIYAVKRGLYPTVKLKEVVDIISGRNFKKYVERDRNAAVLIQAGAVRDLELNVDLSAAPYVSFEDYQRAKRAQVEVGDVLVTTTGQYLGRAAVVDSLSGPAVASGAVTILRPQPRSEVAPFFLAAVISSDLGKEQIARLQAAATAQPYVRRSDLGEILIPIPALSKQQAIAERIRGMLIEARELARRVQALESEAKKLVISELLGVSDDE